MKYLLADSGKFRFQSGMTDSTHNLVERTKTAILAAGGPVALSRKLADMGAQITSQAISSWSRVPAERVLLVARAARCQPHDVRPDLYPRRRAAASRR